MRWISWALVVLLISILQTELASGEQVAEASNDNGVASAFRSFIGGISGLMGISKREADPVAKQEKGNQKDKKVSKKKKKNGKANKKGKKGKTSKKAKKNGKGKKKGLKSKKKKPGKKNGQAKKKTGKGKNKKGKKTLKSKKKNGKAKKSNKKGNNGKKKGGKAAKKKGKKGNKKNNKAKKGKKGKKQSKNVKKKNKKGSKKTRKSKKKGKSSKNKKGNKIKQGKKSNKAKKSKSFKKNNIPRGKKGQKLNRLKQNKRKNQKLRKEKKIRKSKKLRRKLAKKKRKNKTTACVSTTCLSTMTKTLKIEKDLVKNFLAQFKRIDSKLRLMTNKGSKNDSREATAQLIAKRLGSVSSFNTTGPLCAGEFNSTKGKLAMFTGKTLHECNVTIGVACDMRADVNKTTMDTLKACNTTMENYNTKSYECGKDASNCSCWTALEKMSAGVKKCNIAKTVEDMIKPYYVRCKSAFINCSKAESESIKYMAECYTSMEKMVKNLKEYMEIQDSGNKVLKALNAVISSSTREVNRGNSRSKRLKESSVTVCSEFVLSVRSFGVKMSVTNMLGKSTSITSLGFSIVKKTVKTCTTSETTSLASTKATITVRLTVVAAKIASIQAILRTLSSSTISAASLSLSTFPLPDSLDVVTDSATTATTTTKKADAAVVEKTTKATKTTTTATTKASAEVEAAKTTATTTTKKVEEVVEVAKTTVTTTTKKKEEVVEPEKTTIPPTTKKDEEVVKEEKTTTIAATTAMKDTTTPVPMATEGETPVPIMSLTTLSPMLTTRSPPRSSTMKILEGTTAPILVKTPSTAAPQLTTSGTAAFDQSVTTVAPNAIKTSPSTQSSLAPDGETPIEMTFVVASSTKPSPNPLYTTTTASPAITTELRRTTTAALDGETPVRLDETSLTPTAEVPVGVTTIMPSTPGTTPELGGEIPIKIDVTTGTSSPSATTMPATIPPTTSPGTTAELGGELPLKITVTTGSTSTPNEELPVKLSSSTASTTGAPPNISDVSTPIKVVTVSTLLNELPMKITSPTAGGRMAESNLRLVQL